jgi:hypothetical protein
MIPGRLGPRRCTKLHFAAISRRCQRSRVSGETTVTSSSSALRPTALAFLASGAWSASVNRIRFPRSRSLISRFSASFLESPHAPRDHSPADDARCRLAQSDGAWFDAFPPHRRLELSTQ